VGSVVFRNFGFLGKYAPICYTLGVLPRWFKISMFLLFKCTNVLLTSVWVVT